MKIWNIAILGLLAAVNGASSLAQDQVQQNDDCQLMKNSVYEDDIIEELFLDDCAKLEYVRNDVVKTVISTAKVVHSCSKEIIGVLNSHGAVIIIGADKSDIALACLKLNTQNELFFNKYYDLTQRVKNLIDNIFIADDLEIKVYTSRHSIIDKLRAFILDSKYDEAVEFSKYIYYSKHPDVDVGKNIIISVVNQILKENMGYQIMEFAFKLFKKDTMVVFDECFPGVFLRIFNEKKLKILNKEKTGILRLSEEIDRNDDRWLNIDYLNPNETYQDIYWTFRPVWNTTINTVDFIFKNPYYEMRMKLDITLRNDERWAWGDHRSVDPYGRHYQWRLLPVGFNEHEQLLFRLYDPFYDSCLALGTGAAEKEHVKASKQSCTPDMGWILDW